MSIPLELTLTSFCNRNFWCFQKSRIGCYGTFCLKFESSWREVTYHFIGCILIVRNVHQRSTHWCNWSTFWNLSPWLLKILLFINIIRWWSICLYKRSLMRLLITIRIWTRRTLLCNQNLTMLFYISQYLQFHITHLTLSQLGRLIGRVLVHSWFLTHSGS